MIFIILMLICTTLNAASQLLLKHGITHTNLASFSWDRWPFFLGEVLQNPYLIIGVLLQPISLTLWVVVLSRVEVSYAAPMLCLSYIFVALGGYVLMNESVSLMRILGIGIIIGGVYIVARS